MVIVTAAYNVNFMVEVRATAREVITGVDETASNVDGEHPNNTNRLTTY